MEPSKPAPSVSSAPLQTPASPAQRLAAKLLDWAIIGLLAGVVSLPWMIPWVLNRVPMDKLMDPSLSYFDLLELLRSQWAPLMLWMTITVFAVSAVYTIPLTALTGATPGKRTFKMVVASAGKVPPGWKPAFLRWILPTSAPGVPGIGQLLGVGAYGWILVDKMHRGWHDLIAKTMVVVDDRKTFAAASGVSE